MLLRLAWEQAPAKTRKGIKMREREGWKGMGSPGPGGVLSLTEGEVGQRAGLSGSGWGASAGEIWKQERAQSEKGRLGKGTVLQNQGH